MTIVMTPATSPVDDGGLNWYEMMDQIWSEVPGLDLSGFLRTGYQALDRVAGMRRWQWLMKSYDFSLTASTTDIVVTVTQGDATVTATTGNFTSSMAGMKFRTATSQVYTISTYTDTTNIELDRVFVEDTATSQSSVIFEDTYDLPTDFRQAIKLRNLSQQSPITFEAVSGIYDDVGGYFDSMPLGDVACAYLGEYGSNYVRTLVVDHAPENADRIRLWYMRHVVLNDTDTLLSVPDCPPFVRPAVMWSVMLDYISRPDPDPNQDAKQRQILIQEINQRRQEALMKASNIDGNEAPIEFRNNRRALQP